MGNTILSGNTRGNLELEPVTERALRCLGEQIVGILPGDAQKQVDVLGRPRAFMHPDLEREPALEQPAIAEWIVDPQICATLSRKLTWSHFSELLTISDQRKREYYAVTSSHERWSVRTLRERIASKLYERKLPAAGSAASATGDLASLAMADIVEPDIVFRDPYVLNFLGLPAEHSEADLERAILDEIQHFLLELGVGFAFVDRQKRMPVDGRDYRLDLPLYHITMRCYVAVELKARALEPGDYGQMMPYLHWLAAHQRHPGDAAPIGIILCTEKGPEQVALLGLDSGEVRAARYVVDSVRGELERVVERAKALGGR